jgi:hypothetical protein
VRDFARLTPSALAGEGVSPAAWGERGLAEADLSAEASANAEAGMAQMSKRFEEAGGELYVPAAE